MAEPYYQDEHVRLFLGDCLERHEWWQQADVLITDPPYGIGGGLSAGYKGRRPAGGFKPTHADQAWDRSLEARDAALRLWGPSRPRAVFGSPKRLDAAPDHREVPLVWDKGELVGMGDLSFPWRVNYELIYVLGDWSGSRTSTAVLRYPLSNRDASRIGHPTPKPLGLMGNLVERAPAGVIADPFAGSGSTLLAAKEHGRRAIGVELDERYCEIAARRLSQGVLDLDGVGA